MATSAAPSAPKRTAASIAVEAVGTADWTGVPLREVLVHMIEEYARHNGHADLLRERIDGLPRRRVGGRDVGDAGALGAPEVLLVVQ